MSVVTQSVDPKQPDEVRIYVGDWRQRLAQFPGVTIQGSTWAVVIGSGLVLSGPAIDAVKTQTSVTVSAGTAGETYFLRNTVTLSDGQTWHGYGALDVLSESALLRF